jgi:tetratricopeptide (TPR) repeat protein
MLTGQIVGSSIGAPSMSWSTLTTMRRFGRVLVSLALIFPGSSWAGPPSPKADAVDDARNYYQDALREYNLGHFSSALTAFEAAYKVSGDSVLLFNIAQCHRMLSQPREAILAYRAYLREMPNAPNREQVERLASSLEEGLEKAASAASRSEARKRYDEANAAYDRGDFELAQSAFLEAYRLWPDPKIMFDVAQTQRLTGHPQEAISSLKTFLQGWPEPGARQVADRLIKDLSRQVELQRHGVTHCDAAHPLQLAVVLPERVTSGRLIRSAIQTNCNAYLAAYYVEDTSTEMLWPSNEEPKPSSTPQKTALLPSAREEAAGIRLRAEVRPDGQKTEGQLVIFAFSSEADYDRLLRKRPSVTQLEQDARLLPAASWARAAVRYAITK